VIDYFQAPGTTIHDGQFKSDKMLALEKLISSGKASFVTLLERKITSSSDVIVLELDLELSQTRLNNIRSRERVAIQFLWNDNSRPEVLALRKSFPQVPHLNHTEHECKSLCVYETPYDEQKLNWSSMVFLEDIRMWFKKTAEGTLHDQGQRTEPFLFPGSFKIILPNEINMETDYEIAKLSEQCLKLVVKEGNEDESKFEYVVITLKCEPVVHGVINKHPSTIQELSSMGLMIESQTIISKLRDRCNEINQKNSSLLNKKLLILLAVPMKREASLAAETEDVFAFLISDTIKEVGVKVGVWDISPDKKSIGILLSIDQDKEGHDISLAILNPIRELTREFASIYNGIKPCDKSFVAIGVGAIGSNVVSNLSRAGVGRWTLIDPDILLPHNVARHLLPGHVFPGQSKVKGVASFVYTFTEDCLPIHTFERKIQELDDSERKSLESANYILDMSASIAVARYVAHDLGGNARKASLFFNPAGTDLVVFSEDKDRTITLDELEYLYYREVARNDKLSNHFTGADGQLRYGQSCRDVSSIISQNDVAILSGIASKKVLDLLDNSSSDIGIWKIDSTEYSVDYIKCPISSFASIQLKNTCIKISTFLIRDLFFERSKHIPKETGGILLGGFDSLRKILYLMDFVDAPTDSVRCKTHFIRGSDGLLDHVSNINKKSGGFLTYVGEWHSHPDTCSCSPSVDDKNLYGWMLGTIEVAEYAPIMCIVGESDELCLVIGEEEVQVNCKPYLSS
jgi:integrative and conjugative element protein (TIGR02256 family)